MKMILVCFPSIEGQSITHLRVITKFQGQPALTMTALVPHVVKKIIR